MSNWLFQLFISLLILLLADFPKTAKANDDEPPIDQDLPLVLIKTDDDIRLPTNVFMTSGLTGRKKIQFATRYDARQSFYCPAEDDKQRNEIAKAMQGQNRASGDSTREKIDENCLMRKKKNAKPAPQCQKPARPKIMKVLTENKTESTGNKDSSPKSAEVPCGPNGIGKLLGFGYQVCFQRKAWGKLLKPFKEKSEVHPLKGTQEVLFYTFCYAAGTNEILYTTNTIRDSTLFTDTLMEKDRAKTWPIEAYNSIHIPGIDFELVKLKFLRVNGSSDFRIQELVHPEDFPMGIWKKPAYHYVNANLIHKDLRHCWNAIHKTLRVQLLKEWMAVGVLTGTFQVPETGPPQIIDEVPIPKIWVKVVYSVTSLPSMKQAVVIIANNYRDEAVGNVITEKYMCKKNSCKKFLAENFPSVLNDIRCCPLTNEIQALFGTKLESKNILEISGLVFDEDRKRFTYAPHATPESRGPYDDDNYYHTSAINQIMPALDPLAFFVGFTLL